MSKHESWERVEFPSRRGVGLVGCWHRGPGRSGVILCHGMESCKEGEKSVALAESLVRAGRDVLRFDFSYVGESEGRFEDITIRGEVDDLAGAWRFVRARIAGPIGVVGSSLGGTVALLYAAEQPEMAALATIAAVAVPGRRARALPEDERRRWRAEGTYDLYGTRVGSAFLEDVETLDVARAIAGIRCPVLLTHGTDDEVVPVEDAEVIAEAVGGRARVMRFSGADHRFSEPASRTAMLEVISSWMCEQLDDVESDVA